MKKIAVLSLSALVATGCVPLGQVKLIPGAENVRITRTAPPAGYHALGPVSGADGKGCGAEGYPGTHDRALGYLRNHAYTMGASYVQISKESKPHAVPGCYDNVYTISGTAYGLGSGTRAAPAQRPMPGAAPMQAAPAPAAKPMVRGPARKLEELKRLHDRGLITDQEYKKAKERVLRQYY